MEVWDIPQTWLTQCLGVRAPRYGRFPAQQAGGESREAVLRDRDSQMPDPRKLGGRGCGRFIGVGHEGRRSCLKRNHGC